MLLVSGADLLDGTPIYDIKPYLPFTDSHPDAVGGFADDFVEYGLEVEFPEGVAPKCQRPNGKRCWVFCEQDPRPSYQHDAERVYGVTFGNQNIRFQVQGAVLRVIGVASLQEPRK